MLPSLPIHKWSPFDLLSWCVAALDLSGNKIDGQRQWRLLGMSATTRDWRDSPASNNVKSDGGGVPVDSSRRRLTVGGRLVRVKMEVCHTVCASSSRMPEEPLMMLEMVLECVRRQRGGTAWIVGGRRRRFHNVEVGGRV